MISISCRTSGLHSDSGMSGSGVVMAKFYQLPCHSAPGFLRSY
jgi:hypothetical protein